jgi:hypothetical protein
MTGRVFIKPGVPKNRGGFIGREKPGDMAVYVKRQGKGRDKYQRKINRHDYDYEGPVFHYSFLKKIFIVSQQ